MEMEPPRTSDTRAPQPPFSPTAAAAPAASSPVPPAASASPPPSPSLESIGREPLPHVDAMAIVKKELRDLLEGDPLLADLPSDIRVEEVNLQIALEHGQAMTVIVRRADNTTMPVVVMQTGTVLDLKRAIRRCFELKLDRDGVKKKVGWRYVWRSYYLSFQGEKLSDDYKRIREYGIRNRSEVTFVKRLHRKGSGY